MDTLDDFTLREILALAAQNNAQVERAVRATCRRFRALIGAPISVNIVYVLRRAIKGNDWQTFDLILRELSAEIDANVSLHIHAQSDIIDNFFAILKNAYCSRTRSNVFAKTFLEYVIQWNIPFNVWQHISRNKTTILFARTLSTWNEREIREITDLYAQLNGLTIDWTHVIELPVYDNFLDLYGRDILRFISNKHGPLVDDMQNERFSMDRFFARYQSRYNYISYLVAHILAYKYKIHSDAQLCHDSRGTLTNFVNLHPIPIICTDFTREYRRFLATPYDGTNRSSTNETRKIIETYVNESNSVSRETELDLFARKIVTDQSFISDSCYHNFGVMRKGYSFPIGSSAFVDDIMKRISNGETLYNSIAQMRRIYRFDYWIAHCLLSSWIIEPIISRNYRGLPLPNMLNYDASIIDVLVNGIHPREFERGFVQISHKITGNIFQRLIRQIIYWFRDIPYAYQCSRIIFDCWHGAKCAKVVISYDNETSFVRYLMSINRFPNVIFHH